MTELRSADRRNLAVVVGLLGVVAVRTWTAWSARTPQVVADETAYLAMARYLAGGPAWNLGEAAAYMPLYSVVLAPAELLGLSPDATYRFALAANVVLAALTFLAVEALARRTTRLDRPWTAVAASLATSLPALALSSRFAWSDNLAPLCFALIALAGLRLIEHPTSRRAAAFTAAGIAGYFAHSRFLTVLAVMAVVLVVLAARRLLDRRVAVAAVVAMAAGVVVADVVVGRLVSALNMADRESAEFSRVLKVPDLLVSVLGQAWYLTVTTGGLALAGGLALLLAAWHRWRRTDPAPSPVAERLAGGELAWLVAIVAISFATSAGFMTDRPRPDHLVYGRYNDMFVAPLVVLGLAALVTAWTWRRAAVTAAASVVLALGTAQLLHHRELEVLTGPFMPSTIMGLFALDPLATQRIRSIALLGSALIVAVAALGAVGAAVRGSTGRSLVFGCAALVLATGLWRAHHVYTTRYVQPDPSAVTEVADVRPDEDIVCASTAGCPLLDFYRYQFYVPDRRFVLTWDESWREADVVLAGKEGADADLLADLGYERVWADPTSHGSLWVR